MSERAEVVSPDPIMGHMCHMPVAEVDPQTGQISFLDYVAVHDCGTMINPMTVDGHVRGGTAQGIGTAFFEEFQYDNEGQLLGASFHDYLMPRAAEMPAQIRVGHLETPSPTPNMASRSPARAAAWWRHRHSYLRLRTPCVR